MGSKPSGTLLPQNSLILQCSCLIEDYILDGQVEEIVHINSAAKAIKYR